MRRRQKIARQYNFSKLKNLGLILLTLSLIWYLHGFFFTLKQITCHIAAAPCPANVSTELNKFQGKKLYQINITEINKRVLVNHEYKINHLTLKIPGRLDLDLSPSGILCRFAAGPAGPVYALTENHFLLPVSGQYPELTLITSQQFEPIDPSRPVTAPVLTDLLKLLDILKNYQLIPMQITADAPPSVYVFINPSTHAIMSLDSDLNQQTAILAAILKENIKAGEIDLRYSKPIIRNERTETVE
jgi:hypothetical protein